MNDKDHPTTEYDDYGSENNYATGYDDGYESDGHTSEDYESGEYESDDYESGDYASDDYDAEYSDSYASDDYDAEDDDPEYYDSEQYAAGDYDDAYDQGEYDAKSADPATIDPDSIPPEILEPYYDKSAFKWLKNMNRAKLIRLVSMLIFSIAILVFASIAWFSVNKNVGADGMGVAVGTSPFSLASRGDNSGAISYEKVGDSYESTAVNDLDGAIGAEEGRHYTYNNTVYYVADSSDTIIWNLTSAYDPKDEGIHPDSHGSFTFYIIPNVDTGFSVDITLQIDGYKATVNKNSERDSSPLVDYDGTFRVDDLELIEEDDDEYTAVEHLNRRLLFFGNGAKGSYTNFISDKTVSISYADVDVTKGVPIPVTIQWIWPKTFAQMACIGDTENNITNDSTTVAALQEYIVAEPGLLLAASKLSSAEALAKMADSSVVEGETTYEFNSSKANTNIIALSEGYNVADSLVGKDVQYFLLSITAE